VGRYFIQGRTFAATFDEAVQGAIDTLAKRNFSPVGAVGPYPCPVQPRANLIWWEWQIEVEEVITCPDKLCL